jgi:hypothetical protein
LGTSSVNHTNIDHVCAMARGAVKDKTLGERSILIIPMYKAQAHLYQATLDSMLCSGLLTLAECRRIMVRTVDGAQGFTADIVFVDFTRTHSPGFTSDRRRLCVALTRARHAEVIVMSRGIFGGLDRPAEEFPHGQNPKLLKAIYEDIFRQGGVVTSNIAVTQAADDTTAEEDKRNRCVNCKEVGHRQKECTAVLKCGNCDEVGHASEYCLLPQVQRCRKCRDTGHLAQNCPTADQAPGGKEQHTNKKCRNCNAEGHLISKCNYCTICKEDGHVTKRCPTVRKCRVCKQTGHKVIDCPEQECLRCGERGHHDSVCEKRHITDDITFAPSRTFFTPRKVNFKNTAANVVAAPAGDDASAAQPSVRARLIAAVNDLVDPNTRAKGFEPRQTTWW